MNCYPKRFDDDGTNVTVDVHGCTVEESVHIVRRCVQEAFRRGRGRVVVIHGLSLDADTDRTIKNEIQRRMEMGEFEEWVSGFTQDSGGGRSTLWIRIGGLRNPTPIRINDVVMR